MVHHLVLVNVVLADCINRVFDCSIREYQYILLKCYSSFNLLIIFMIIGTSWFDVIQFKKDSVVPHYYMHMAFYT